MMSIRLERNAKHYSLTHGFTAVELLIVIVVIAVVTGIAVVAYGALKTNAAESAIKSDLRNAATQLKIDRNHNNNYPASADAADGGNGLRSSDNVTLAYSYNAGSGTYCLSGSFSGIQLSFHIVSTDDDIQEGECSP